MDTVVTVAKMKADIAKSVAKNLAVNSIEALGSILEGKKDSGLDAKLEKRYAAMRLKLFLKYTMIDYEVLASRVQRNDVYAELMEGSKL
jgi:hypothetical protein